MCWARRVESSRVELFRNRKSRQTRKSRALRLFLIDSKSKRLPFGLHAPLDRTIINFFVKCLTDDTKMKKRKIYNPLVGAAFS